MDRSVVASFIAIEKFKIQVDYIEPYLALKESFNKLGERHESSDLQSIEYKQSQTQKFIVDSMTFMEKMFIVRLDLRTLAGPILGYKFA